MYDTVLTLITTVQADKLSYLEMIGCYLAVSVKIKSIIVLIFRIT